MKTDVKTGGDQVRERLVREVEGGGRIYHGAGWALKRERPKSRQPSNGGNGNYVGEGKVFCSFDSKKGELRVGGVKFTPVGLQGRVLDPAH